LFPNASHTYVDVGDVAEIIIRAADGSSPPGERYLAGKEQLTMSELNALVGELAGVRVPRLRIPGVAAMAMASALTAFANLTKRPPLLGMARDSFATMRAGMAFDGSKAERELGICYKPVRESFAEEIDWHRADLSD
jgi:dihydroflavonol-4-reductase